MTPDKRKIALAAVLAVAILSAFSAAGRSAAAGIRLDVLAGTPSVLAGAPRRAFVKVSLWGDPMEDGAARAPVNVAIVLDRSGSMGGEKIRKAKDAALQAVDRLGPDDIVSVVAYNHTVDVLVPATKLRSRDDVYRKIESIFASGDTALFAGVSKGAHEVMKFAERGYANRIVLLSDGLANVGPSSPGDLGDLGWSLGRQGISVSTIGLGDGYNEDLMVALAGQSDGNHAFAENAQDLSRIFAAEFGDVLSIAAQEVTVHIDCPRGIKPIRVLGRRADISGQSVVARLAQVYARQEKFVLLEVEIAEGTAGENRVAADVAVRYAHAKSSARGTLTGRATVTFTATPSDVEARANRDVLVAAAELVANERNKNAIALRDQGRLHEAAAAFEENALFLETEASRYKSEKLKERATANRSAKSNMAPDKWVKQRKRMADDAFQLENQQAW